MQAQVSHAGDIGAKWHFVCKRVPVGQFRKSPDWWVLLINKLQGLGDTSGVVCVEDVCLQGEGVQHVDTVSYSTFVSPLGAVSISPSHFIFSADQSSTFSLFSLNGPNCRGAFKHNRVEPRHQMYLYIRTYFILNSKSRDYVECSCQSLQRAQKELWFAMHQFKWLIIYIAATWER